MRVSLTNFSSGLSLDELLSEPVSDGNDLVTTSSEGRAEGLKADHGKVFVPYLRCNPLGTVDIYTVQHTFCSRCGASKPLTEFYMRRRKGRRPAPSSWCKACTKEVARQGR